jgi:hypothetical protein
MGRQRRSPRSSRHNRTSYQTVLASLANGGSYSTTFSGTVTVRGADAVVLEPATSVLLGSGLALTAFIRRRAARARN